MQHATTRLSFAVRLGRSLLLAGAALALVIAILVAWADFEGLSYFSSGAGYDPFDGLQCPSVMSSTEKATVLARLANPTNKDIEPHYRVDISSATQFRMLNGEVAVPAHSSREVAWTVDANDIDLGFFVLVRMAVLPVAGNATREATCGILALNMGNTTGSQALGLAVAASALLSLAGLILPAVVLAPKDRLKHDSDASTHPRRALQALCITSAGATLPALAGAWLAAWILCMISVILLMIVLRYALS
jgi:hypothetical protein